MEFRISSNDDLYEIKVVLPESYHYNYKNYKEQNLTEGQRKKKR